MSADQLALVSALNGRRCVTVPKERCLRREYWSTRCWWMGQRQASFQEGRQRLRCSGHRPWPVIISGNSDQRRGALWQGTRPIQYPQTRGRASFLALGLGSKHEPPLRHASVEPFVEPNFRAIFLSAVYSSSAVICCVQRTYCTESGRAEEVYEGEFVGGKRHGRVKKKEAWTGDINRMSPPH